MAGNIHVLPNGNDWVVKIEGEQAPLFESEDKAPAVEFARKDARDREVELVIHDHRGRIQEKDSHGNDPREIPG